LPYLLDPRLHLCSCRPAPRWRADLTASYVGEMRVVAGRGSPTAAERVDDHWVIDLAAGFDLNERVSLFARIENLLDDDYLAALRPAGSRPGRPQTALVGVNVAF
jgi:Fe(3+) dicitrate transport protein